MHTLLYAILQAFNRNQCTVETIRLHGKMISAVNEEIAKSQRPSSALIGAVMILAAAACRFDDHDVYVMHSKGLAQLVKISELQSQLTPAIDRAMFWLDLISSICLDSPRMRSHRSLPNQPSWSRMWRPAPFELPVGLLRHQMLIPDELLDCLQDIVELQSMMKDQLYQRDHMLLDDMQASIESRLSFVGPECRLLGDMAEMIRLAAFICCYCCWTDMWDSNVIPSKVAKLLLRKLQSSIGTSELEASSAEAVNKGWRNRGDLLLWLVFVGAMVSQGNEFVAGLRKGYGKLIEQISQWVSGPGNEQMWSLETLHAIRADFLYCDGWMEKRSQLREWFVLEVSFGLVS